MRIRVSSAKAHEERGRVERKIRQVRETLEQMGVQVNSPMTALQWDSLFCKVASSIDDLPLAKGNTSNVSSMGYEIITANRIKLGRNNHRSLEGAGIHLDLSPNVTKILERNKEIYRVWYQMFIDNIDLLMLKPAKWEKTGKLPVLGDIVVFTFNDSGYSKSSIVWKIGKVVKVVTPDEVTISYASRVQKKAPPTMLTVARNPRDISVLFSVDDLFVNTRDHHNDGLGK